LSYLFYNWIHNLYLTYPLIFILFTNCIFVVQPNSSSRLWLRLWLRPNVRSRERRINRRDELRPAQPQCRDPGS
jgi:hypothetical protein